MKSDVISQYPLLILTLCCLVSFFVTLILMFLLAHSVQFPVSDFSWW